MPCCLSNVRVPICTRSDIHLVMHAITCARPKAKFLQSHRNSSQRTLHYKWELPIWLRITLALSGKTRNPNGSRSRDLIAPTGKGCLGWLGALAEKRSSIECDFGYQVSVWGGTIGRKNISASANVVRTQCTSKKAKTPWSAVDPNN